MAPKSVLWLLFHTDNKLYKTDKSHKTLFDFNRSDNGLNFYWTGAVKNLDAEADACEQVFVQQDVLQVPAMPDASSIVSTSSSSSLA